MISNEFLEFILAAENLLVEGLGISDRLGIHLIASLRCKLVKLDLVPGEVISGESDGPIKLLQVGWIGKLVVWLEILLGKHFLNSGSH